MDDGMSQEIEAILDAYHMDTLLSMVRTAGLSLPEARRLRKAQVKAVMRERFFTRERVRASLARLQPEERAVLNRLLLRGGPVPTDSLQREVVRAGLATEAPKPSNAGRGYHHEYVPYVTGGYTGSPDRASSRVFDDVIARLTLHGLVFSRLEGDDLGPLPKLQFHPGETLFVPAAVREHLDDPQPVAQPELTPSAAREEEPALLLRDLYLYWDYARRNEVPRTKAGYVSKRALRAINAALLVPDPLLDDARNESETGRLLLLGELLHALKLVHAAPDGLRPAGRDPLHIPEFWSWPEAKQVEACLEAWPRLLGWRELSGEATSLEPQLAAAREALLAALRDGGYARWREPEALLEELQGRDPEFLFPGRSRIRQSRGYSYGGYYNSHYYGSPEMLLRSLNGLEARFVQAALTGILSLLGLVELGTTGDRLVAFRLTPLGRAILGQPGAEPPAEEGEAGRVILQPNFQLVAMGPVPLATLARLDLFAEREQADRGAFAYRLSRESVYRAQQAGMGVAEIVSFLEEAGDVEVPQNVRRSLEEWAAHHQRIVFRSGVSLLQAATPELLAELLAGPAAEGCQARAVTPDVALLAGSGRKRLVAALVARGIFPAVSGADPQSADASVVVDAEGAIRPIHAVPSLHLRGRLARLAEEGPNGDGEWRLTPASVHRAGGNRSRVVRLLEELERLQRGALPEALVEQVKAWGGYYGDAAAETLTLVEFADGEALEELLERPDLQGLLTPFPAGRRTLAVVPAGRLAELRAILARLGVRVREGL